MKFQIITFGLISFLNIAYCSVVSKAINEQTQAVNALKKVNDTQNNEIKSKNNVKKRKILDLRHSVFLVKQRNELIMNYFYIDSVFLKEE